jgi:hypothetical protein
VNKPCPIPNIDLGGVVQVIDDSGAKPRWREVGRCVATLKNAEEILRANGLRQGWLYDGFERRLVSVR